MRYSERPKENGDLEGELKLSEDELANLNYRLDKEGYVESKEIKNKSI